MAHANLVVNPFMLMLAPEAVFAAVEKSERLNRLERRLCRPLDRGMPQLDGKASGENLADAGADDLEDDTDERAQ